MAKRKNVENLCEKDLLVKILRIVEQRPTPDSVAYAQRLYDNKSLMEMLNVKEKYLKKPRDNGYLGYSRQGDKYWYSQKDVDDFLKRFHYDAFATNPLHPIWEGGAL